MFLRLAQLSGAAASGKVETAHGLAHVVHGGADVDKGQHFGVASERVLHETEKTNINI